MACEINETTIDLTADTIFPGTFLGYGDIHTYKFTMSENETISFNVDIQQSNGSNPNATLKLYRVEHNDDITDLGISYLYNFYNSFEYDGIVGNYFLCLENLYESTYELSASFTDYEGILMPIAIAYTGEGGDSIDELPLEPICHEEIGYEMIDGELPTGLTFYSNGNIWGIAEEQDCDSRSDEAPSWNWKEYQHESEGCWPTFKEYYFRVSAYFMDHPYIKTDREFKICVHNNWDLDDQRDNMDNLTHKEYIISYVDVELDPTGLCPCTETKEIITERIVDLNRNISDNWREEYNQLDKLMYEKQCPVRHDIVQKPDIFIEPVPVDNTLPDTLCPICPDDK